ncbi:MAG: hypothetical protein ACI9XO_003193 [Paraglaciecola sp.]|jgi:hypothetical protein
MRQLLTFLCLFLSTYSFAQISTLYPIKQNHLWGYMNQQGEVVLEPKYDAIADKNLRWNRGISSISPYRLVEIDGKLGAIDGNGVEVVSPDWLEIRPINTNLFAVRSDTGFQLINAQGNSFIFSQYDDFQLIMSEGVISSKYFQVKKDTAWGIFDLENGELIAPQFGRVKLSNPVQDYFQVNEWKDSERWGLFTKKGKQLLPYGFKNIAALHSNNIFAQDMEDRWMVFDSLGQQLFEEGWSTYRQLNKHVVGVKGKNWEWKLFFFDKQNTANFETKYERFLNLSHGYITGKAKEKWSIIDSLGNEILPPTFKEIKAFNPPLFRVKDKAWGIYSLINGLIVKTDYQVISPFEDGLAKVRRDGNWGMVNNQGEEIIPIKFETFQREGNIIKGFAGETMTMFEMSDSNTVISEEFFEEVYNLRVGYNIKTQDVGFGRNDINAAVRQGRQIRRNFRASYGSDTTLIENSKWSFEFNEMNYRYALFNKEMQEAVTPPSFNMIRHIANGRLTMVFAKKPFAENRLASYASFPVDTACSMALFSHDLGKFITPFDMMGLRRHDFERGLPYAVFIDLEGKMGLIDRDGQQLTNANGTAQRFDFIDDFQQGITRVCTGGRIAAVENPEEEKIAISNVKMLTHGFFVTPTHLFENNSTAKFYYKKNGLQTLQWGYIDSLGQTVIEPQFEYANQFLDSMAVNKKDGAWGLVSHKNEVLLDFIHKSITPFGSSRDRWRVNIANSKPIFFNKKGHEVISLKHEKFGGFFDDMCRVRVDSLWGYVDIKGNEVIACQYEEARNFSEGMAGVFVDNKWTFIDKIGKEVLNPSAKITYLEEVGSFNDGLCWYKVGKFYGYFDKTGKAQIEPQYTKAFDFNNEVARVVYDAKTGVIDTKGHWLLKPKDFEVIFPFDENGVAVVREKFNQKNGFINNKGEILTDLKYAFVGEFYDGYARVSDTKGYGFVDTQGREVIPCVYREAKEVSDGLVAVMSANKLAWEFRNMSNKKAFKGAFARAENYTEGLAFVQLHEFNNSSKMWLDKAGNVVNPVPEDFVKLYAEGIFGMYKAWGIRRNFRTLNYYFCDAKGKNLFNEHYEEIQAFDQGTAPVKIRNRWGVINRAGMTVVQPKYSRINQTKNGLVHAMPGLISGITDKWGQAILPTEFDEVRVFRNLIRVELGEKIGYVTTAGEWVWDLQH